MSRDECPGLGGEVPGAVTVSASYAGMRQPFLSLMNGAARNFGAMSAEHLPCDDAAQMAVVPFKAAVDFAPAPGRKWVGSVSSQMREADVRTDRVVSDR